MIKLPMKFRILQIICENSINKKNIDTNKIIKLIKLEYGEEKQCNPKTIKMHVLSLKSVGLINELNVHMCNNELISEYNSTKEGFKRMKLTSNTSKTYKKWSSFATNNLVHSN